MKEIALEPNNAKQYWICAGSSSTTEKAKYFRKVYFRLLYLKILTDWGYFENDIFEIFHCEIGKDCCDLIFQVIFEKSEFDEATLKELTDNTRNIIKSIRPFTRLICPLSISDKKEPKQRMTKNAYAKIIDNIFQIGLVLKEEINDSNNKTIDFDALGYIFEETLDLTGDNRKGTGAYYTPKWVTQWLTSRTITNYILSQINKKIEKYNNENHKNIALLKDLSCLDNLNSENSDEDRLITEYLFGLLKNIKICDNACGAGAFLEPVADYLLNLFDKVVKKNPKLLQNEPNFLYNSLEIKRYILSNLIFGTDINEQAVELSRIRLLLWFFKREKALIEKSSRTIKRLKNSAYENNELQTNTKELIESIERLTFNIRIGNSLLPDSNSELENEKFDIIIGNPPYGNLLSASEKESLQQIYPFSASKEISSYFVARSIDKLKEGGNLTYIITYAITFNTELTGIRKLITNSFEKTNVITFDRDKCNIFSSMTQSVSFLECCNKFHINSHSQDQGSIFSSEMFRRIPNSLEKLGVENVDGYLFLCKELKLGKDWSKQHRLPKLGTHKPILDKLQTCNNLLGNLLLKNGGEQIWYRNTGNYWYNAWTWKPYSSSDIHPLYIKKGFIDFVILIINSQIFYIWNRIYGDGRHLNTDLLNGFPIPDLEKIRQNQNEISRWKDILMAELKRVYDEKRKRFMTSEIKKTLDLIDLFLGNLYGFDSNEIGYILDYEREIHGGSQIDIR